MSSALRIMSARPQQRAAAAAPRAGLQAGGALPRPLALHRSARPLLHTSLQPTGLQLAQRSATSVRRAARLAVSAVAEPAPNTTVGEKIDSFVWSGDDEKEADRKKLRSVFDFAKWKRHRSSSRYWRHMSSIFESRTLKWTAAPLLYVLSVATAVCVYHTAASAGFLPEVLPEVEASTRAPFGLTSFALSTLLVLRTNTSYQRWDEARKMWGLIVNRSRDISRQAMGYIPGTQPELQEMFCRWMAAYPKSLMCHLREGEDLTAELKDKLRPEELRALLASAHRPNYTMQVLTAIIKAAQLPGEPISNYNGTANVKASAAFRMDENLTQFSDTTGGCERILRTPVPLAYTRHNSRFLMIWLTLMPFTLWDNCHWGTLPVSALVAFLLLGIKEIGVALEEPFSILPLEVICNTIETNIWELHSTHSAVAIAKQQAAGSDFVDATALVNAVAPAAPAVPAIAAASANGSAARAGSLV